MILRVETKYKVNTYFLNYNKEEGSWKPETVITLLKDSIIDLIIPDHKIKYRLCKNYISIKSVKYDNVTKKVTIT